LPALRHEFEARRERTDHPGRSYNLPRGLSTPLAACFAGGFVPDRLEEPAFGPRHGGERALGWANDTEIPPALLAWSWLRSRP